jgi:hypothetical protein
MYCDVLSHVPYNAQESPCQRVISVSSFTELLTQVANSTTNATALFRP